MNISARGDTITVTGEAEPVEQVERIFRELVFLLKRNKQLERHDLDLAIDMVKTGGRSVSKEMEETPPVIFNGKGGEIRPKTRGQERYYRTVQTHDIVFAIGPAGTGKTFLAVAMALDQLRQRKVNRIVLCRPAIEAGERLGFLPGDLMEKVDPYLRPLTDALFSMLPGPTLEKYIERKIVEIIPLAYMRGRTLNSAFVILDEAQNTSTMQMKMFLTRLGVKSKAIVTGDDTQIDLKKSTPSGLVQIKKVLKDISGIDFVHLDRMDVVRHRLVKEIIRAYKEYHENSSEKANQHEED